MLIPLTKLLGTSHRSGGREEDLLVAVATARPKGTDFGPAEKQQPAGFACVSNLVRQEGVEEGI